MSTSENRQQEGDGVEVESQSKEKVQVSHLVPQNVREAAKQNAEYGELSEKVRTLYETIAFGEEIGERSQIERELRSIRDKKDDKRAEIRERQQELETLEKRESRLEERLSSLSSKHDKFEGAIEMLEQQLYDGTHIFPEHGGVKQAAALAEVSQEGVMKKLKERNPGVPEHAFKTAIRAERPWNGCTEAEAKEE